MDCANYEYVFIHDDVIRIKASAFDLDGSIAEVQFFADVYNQPPPATNLIGVVSNAPYSVVWKLGQTASWVDLDPQFPADPLFALSGDAFT